MIITGESEAATVIERCLEGFEEYTVETEYAADLPEALKRITNGNIDVVILGSRLSSGSPAKEVLEGFKRAGIDIPVVIVAGRGDRQAAVELMKTGAYDYITSSAVNTKLLEKTVRGALERHILITKQKQLEVVLKEAKTQQQIMLDSAQELIWYSDKTGKIRRANKATAKAVGLDVKDVVGKSAGELFGLDQVDSTTEDNEVISSDRPELNIVRQMQTVDGERWFQVCKVPYTHDNGQTGIIVFAVDITEERRAEEKKREVEEKLIEQNSTNSKFIAAASYELRRLLVTFGSIVSGAMAGEPGLMSPELRENLEAADRAIDGMTKIVDNFLYISKMITGKIEIQKSKVDMQEVVSEAIYLLSNEAVEKNIKLLSALLPDPSFAVYADHGLVRQTFLSLIDNVMGFTAAKSTISVTVRDLDDEVQVSIHDSGVEIDSDEISKVFNRFVQIEQYAGRESYGSGLGLYIAKWLVQAQGGRIWAESTPGHGNIFCFTLPKHCEEIDISAGEAVEISQESRN